MEIEYKFKEKYNPNSNRLQNFDYSSNGAYFITNGRIVFDEIKNINKIDEFIIMPNHIHFILILENNVETSIYHVSNNNTSNNNV